MTFFYPSLEYNEKEIWQLVPEKRIGCLFLFYGIHTAMYNTTII